jgi:hypothetical protein
MKRILNITSKHQTINFIKKMDIILAGNEQEYKDHIKVYLWDKFANFIVNANSLKGLRDITRVIFVGSWNERPDALELCEMIKERMSEDRKFQINL